MVCTAGPCSGEQFTLSGDEAVLGRAADATISIPDTSVSRRHVLLRKTTDGWAASDMGSGNGTLVNGEPIAQETVLRHGDVITVGDTELSFTAEEVGLARRVSSGSALPVRRANSLNSMARARRPSLSRARVDPEAQARKRKVIFGVLGLLTVVGLSIGSVKLYQKLQEQKAEERERVRLQHRQKLGAVFQEGKNLVRQGKWTDAKGKFDAMAAEDLGYPGLKEYLDLAVKEIPNEERLAAVTAALAENRLGDARKALDEVTGDTQMYMLLRAAKKELESKLDARISEARQLMDGGGTKDVARMKQVEAIAADLLVAFPDNRDASELQKQAKEILAELTRPVPVVRPEGPKPWLDVAARFRDGDMSGAFSLANECAARRMAPCKALVAQISTFSEKFKRLDNLNVKELSELSDLDEKITHGGRSKMGQQVGTRLGSAAYKSASAALNSGDYGKAIDLARRTLKVDPGHAGAQSIVSQLRSKSKDLFLQAYSLKETNPDEAIRIFRDVVAMTPKDDENHTKAKNWIEKLGRQ